MGQPLKSINQPNGSKDQHTKNLNVVSGKKRIQIQPKIQVERKKSVTPLTECMSKSS